MNLAEVRAAALQFLITSEKVTAVLSFPKGQSAMTTVGPTPEIFERIDGLRHELRTSMAVASGRVPHLKSFCREWGRPFLPSPEQLAGVDVLVIVPHGELHDLPFHLVLIGEEGPRLGEVVGITYASSRSLFRRCADRNPARRLNLKKWNFDPEKPEAPGRKRSWSVMGGAADLLGNDQRDFHDTCQALGNLIPGHLKLFSGPDSPLNRDAGKTPFRLPEKAAVQLLMAHGFVDSNNHRFSGLLLAKDQMGLAGRCIPLHGGQYFDFRDLPLRPFPAGLNPQVPGEIMTVAELEIDARTRSDLVLLLGCSAGWGRVLQGDEPASLAETFLKIGAASVVAPMWDSDRRAARQWTIHFVTAWARAGWPKALAARHAWQALANQPEYNRPERLGVMCLRGDWI